MCGDLLAPLMAVWPRVDIGLHSSPSAGERLTAYRATTWAARQVRRSGLQKGEAASMAFAKRPTGGLYYSIPNVAPARSHRRIAAFTPDGGGEVRDGRGTGVCPGHERPSAEWFRL
jgi:hypothetical protein